MELWVRSQDKECLMKINRIDYDLSNGEHRIMVDGYKTLIGKYETKQRALEILDEIQRILHPTVFMSAEINTDDNKWVENGIIYQKYKDNFKIQELSTYVYEMPEE